MARLPLDAPVKVTPHGEFGFQRKTPKDGACGRRGVYPCTHLGVDLAAGKGTPVYAPERMKVYAAVFDNATPPLRGFGPGAILAQGVSGAAHIFGHLDPAWWREHTWQIPKSIFDGFIGPARMPSDGRVYREGEQIGVVAKNHLHWEISIEGKKYDPLRWVTGRLATASTGAGQSGALWLLLLALAASRR